MTFVLTDPDKCRQKMLKCDFFFLKKACLRDTRHISTFWLQSSDSAPHQEKR